MNKADLTRELKNLASAFWRLIEPPVLVVGLESFTVRGLIVSRTGRCGWRIERYAEVELETAVRRNRTRLMRLFEKLPADEARRVLLVSDEVSLMQVELPPVEPRRGRRPNEPAWLVHTAACLAQVCGIVLAGFADGTSRNAAELFRFPQRE